MDSIRYRRVLRGLQMTYSPPRQAVPIHRRAVESRNSSCAGRRGRCYPANGRRAGRGKRSTDRRCSLDPTRSFCICRSRSLPIRRLPGMESMMFRVYDKRLVSSRQYPFQFNRDEGFIVVAVFIECKTGEFKFHMAVNSGWSEHHHVPLRICAAEVEVRLREQRC